MVIFFSLFTSKRIARTCQHSLPVALIFSFPHPHHLHLSRPSPVLRYIYTTASICSAPSLTPLMCSLYTRALECKPSYVT